MARRSELVALDVEDFSFLDGGSGRVLIRRSKTDQAGEGSLAYLSPDTVAYLRVWLRASGISRGAVFRWLIVVNQGPATQSSGLCRRRNPKKFPFRKPSGELLCASCSERI